MRPAATRADPDTERYALFDAVTQLLVAAAAESPVLLVIDDLHWAGKTTLPLLRHVLRDAGDVRLLVLKISTAAGGHLRGQHLDRHDAA